MHRRCTGHWARSWIAGPVPRLVDIDEEPTVMVASLGRRSSTSPRGDRGAFLSHAQQPQPYPEGAIDQLKILDRACDVQVRWRASNRPRRMVVGGGYVSREKLASLAAARVSNLGSRFSCCSIIQLLLESTLICNNYSN
jgi:hypothetical protein